MFEETKYPLNSIAINANDSLSETKQDSAIQALNTQSNLEPIVKDNNFTRLKEKDVENFIKNDIENRYIYQVEQLENHKRHLKEIGKIIDTKKIELPFRFLRDQCATFKEIYSYEDKPPTAYLHDREVFMRKKIQKENYLPYDTEDIIKLWGKEPKLDENAIQGFQPSFKKKLNHLLKSNKSIFFNKLNHIVKKQFSQYPKPKMLRVDAKSINNFLKIEATNRYIYDENKLEQKRLKGMLDFGEKLSLRFLKDQCASFAEIYSYKDSSLEPYQQTRITLMTLKNKEKVLLLNDTLDIVKLWGKEREWGEKSIQGFSSTFKATLNHIFRSVNTKFGGFSKVFQHKLNNILKDKISSGGNVPSYIKFSEELQSKQEKVAPKKLSPEGGNSIEEAIGNATFSGCSIQFKVRLNALLQDRLNHQSPNFHEEIVLTPSATRLSPVAEKRVSMIPVDDVKAEGDGLNDNNVSGFSKVFQNKLNKILQTKLDQFLATTPIPMKLQESIPIINQGDKNLLTAFNAQSLTLQNDSNIRSTIPEQIPMQQENDILTDKLANLTI